MSRMLEQIRKNFDRGNNDVCLCIEGFRYSYSDMAARIASIQDLIKKAPCGDIVGIVAENTAQTYASILSCWFLGKGFVPIHPKYPKERNRSIISQSSIQLILSFSSDVYEFLPEGIEIRLTSQHSHNNNSICFDTVTSDWVMGILFTSGSTGLPKGVPMTFKNIECTMDAFFNLGYSFSSSDRFLQMFELTFDMSMLSYLPAFIVGASVYTVGSDKIRYLESAGIIREHSITYAAMVPSTLGLLKPYFNKLNLPSLKYSFLGGEPFPSDLAVAWMNCIPNATIVNISGPTEITMACMGYELSRNQLQNKAHNGILAFGYPWKNTKAILIDENLEIVGPNVTGELCLAGDHVMQGYLNQPDLNKKVFFNKEIQNKIYRFYRTGDMAFIDSEGLFYSCGRKDLQVKIQGHKVELEEIENIAGNILNRIHVVAIAIPDTKGSLQIGLVIEGKEENVEDLATKMQKLLPSYMIPAIFRFVDSFPYNQNGKTDRMKLKRLFE